MELKVRVWDKEQKKFLKIGHSKGEAVPKYSGNLYFTLAGKVDEDGYDYEIDAEILLYSGIKDKNGKEYCVGDIVKVNKLTFETSSPLPDNLIVKYYGGMFQLFRGNEPLMGLHLLYIQDGEIIGNIYEDNNLKTA